MTLWNVNPGESCRVSHFQTGDEGLDDFLFSLGCYCGESVTLISKRRSGCIVSIQNGRYSMDRALAQAIQVEG